jgi:transposase
LWRNLHGSVKSMVVSEPRRNRLITEVGDKDDDLDAEKLAQLLRGGFVKAVHQVETLDRAVFKQHVSWYHHRVRQRVREALRISSLFRQHGVMIRENAFVAEADRPGLLARLPEAPCLRDMVPLLWSSYDAAVAQEEQGRRRLVTLAKQEEVVRRFEALPGVGWIRAATLYAYLDTPWRFRSKPAWVGFGRRPCTPTWTRPGAFAAKRRYGSIWGSGSTAAAAATVPSISACPCRRTAC